MRLGINFCTVGLQELLEETKIVNKSMRSLLNLGLDSISYFSQLEKYSQINQFWWLLKSLKSGAIEYKDNASYAYHFNLAANLKVKNKINESWWR